MDHNKIRAYLALGSSNVESFEANLVNIIKVTIYLLRADGMIADETLDFYSEDLVNHINERFNLEFSETEIDRAIQRRGNNVIISIRTEDNRFKYSLNPKEYSKLKSMESIDLLDKKVSAFCQVNDEFKDWKIDDCILLIYRYFYYLVENSISSLLDLFDREKTNVINDSKRKADFESEEIIFINAFLNWDDNEKNEIIFSLVDYSIDYCMLTMKKGSHSFRQIFQGKTFYLDANVITRLFGLNNKQRQSVLNAFIQKCKSVNIKLVYTNYTQEEIEKLIFSSVKEVWAITGGKRPHSEELYQRYAGEDHIRKLYVDWCLQAGNNYHDKKKFTLHLLSEMKKITDNFQFKSIRNYKIMSSEDYKAYYSSLSDRKRQKRTTNPASLDYDVSNFMYVEELRKKEKGRTFFDLQNYFITCDNQLIEWSKNLYRNTTPIAVLPSVWHSLILRLDGRSTDDIKAFMAFLNLRSNYITNEEEIRNEEVRKRILYNITQRDFDSDFQERVLLNIVDEINYSESVESICEKGIENITQKLKEEGAQEAKSYAFNEGYDEGKMNAIMMYVDRDVARRIKWSKIFGVSRNIICGLALAVLIFSIVQLIIYRLNPQENRETNNIIDSFSILAADPLISGIMTPILFLVGAGINWAKKKFFFSGDEQKIREHFTKIHTNEIATKL